MAKTQELTRPRYTGQISYGTDMPELAVKRGVILILGASPNAKVTILSFDGADDRNRRGEQIDVLRKCTVTGEDNKVFIHGESARALHEMHLDDIVVDITVDLTKPCKDCGYA